MPPDAVRLLHVAGANPELMTSRMVPQATDSALDRKLKTTRVENSPERIAARPHCLQLEKKQVRTVHYACMQLEEGAKMDRLTRWFGDEATAPSNPNAAIQRCCEYEDSMLSPAGVQRLIALCPDSYESILKTKDKDLLVVGTVW